MDPSNDDSDQGALVSDEVSSEESTEDLETQHEQLVQQNDALRTENERIVILIQSLRSSLGRRSDQATGDSYIDSGIMGFPEMDGNLRMLLDNLQTIETAKDALIENCQAGPSDVANWHEIIREVALLTEEQRMTLIDVLLANLAARDEDGGR